MNLELLRQILRQRNLTNAQLAQRAGVTLSTVEKIMSGYNRNPKVDTLLAICGALECSLSDLDPGTDKKNPPDLSEGALRLAREYDTLDLHGIQVVRGVMDAELERLEELSALATAAPEYEPKVINLFLEPSAAGIAAPVAGRDYEPLLLTPEQPQSAAYAVRIQGNSMEPLFYDGDVAFVNHDAVSDGDIGIFCVDGGTVCKQYHRDHMLGITYLFSLNRSRADADVILTDDSSHSLICQGRVITRRRYPIPGLD